MINRFLKALGLGVLGVAVFLPSASVHAQSPECNADYEVIVQMTAPEIGSYNIWDTVWGERDTKEIYIDAVRIDNGNHMVVGLQGNGGPSRVLLMSEVDRRGRVRSVQKHEVADLTNVMRLSPFEGGGFLVVGQLQSADLKTAGIWLGFFDAEAGLVSEQVLSQEAGKLWARDLLVRPDRQEILVVGAVRQNEDGLEFPIIYTLDLQGVVKADRAYKPGSNAQILSLRERGQGQLLATGMIKADDGRKAGWVMMLDSGLKIIWQRQYARGSDARLVASADFLSDFVIVAGQVSPARRDMGHDGGWVMALSGATGDIGWQRYFNGAYDYGVVDVLTRPDGQISVLMNGLTVKEPKGKKKSSAPAPEKEEGGENSKKDFVRLATLNPRGVVMISDEYFNGEGARAARLILGPNQERIVIGNSDVKYVTEAQGDQPEESVLSIDSWIVAGAPMEVYTDPCRP